MPSYKLAKYLNKKLNQLIQLPYMYATKNFNEVTHDLHDISITNHHKIITLDIEDLYVNLPIKNIINITRFWLNKYNNQPIITQQILEIIKTIFNIMINTTNP